MDARLLGLTPAMLCRSVAFLGCCLVVVSGTTADEVAEKAVAAWEKHSSAISSIQYDCEIATTKFVELATTFPPAAPAPDALNPFPDEKAAVQPIVLHSDLAFSMSKGKFALRNVGETW